jgi:hypothetical protein
VKRRYYTVTGENPDEKTVDNLISTGESERFSINYSVTLCLRELKQRRLCSRGRLWLKRDPMATDGAKNLKTSY